jgi:hypothetical protein
MPRAKGTYACEWCAFHGRDNADLRRHNVRMHDGIRVLREVVPSQGCLFPTTTPGLFALPLDPAACAAVGHHPASFIAVRVE